MFSGINKVMDPKKYTPLGVLFFHFELQSLKLKVFLVFFVFVIRSKPLFYVPAKNPKKQPYKTAASDSR